MPDLLIELFSEEIPARMQARACEDLKKRMTDGLVEAGLTYGSAAAFSTPRRLALTVEGMVGESPTLREERKGPKVGAPDKAVEGFLRGAGVSRDALETRDTPKGAVYFATVVKPGRQASEIVAEVLEDVVRNFPWPKSMRWGAGTLRWVRPLHSVLCLLSDEAGAEVVPFEIDGIAAGDSTRGHRFMAPDQFSVTSFEDYAAKLKRAHVMLDAAERADHIWNDATNMAFSQALEVVEDRGLLAEVAGLVEWPVVLMGEIGEDFLGLPPEVLQTSMKEHQKFFSVRNPKTGRIEKFVTVANRETSDQGATILAGNQKVLSARLSDAKFFWENDLRAISDVGLEGMAAPLSTVTFHNKLGSQADRIARIAALAREIAPVVGADPDEAELAAKVAKADLSSEMVYEFPELQGIMGRYYAQKAGLSNAVADAARYHYAPLGPSDDVPSEPVSVTVALADKLDTLTGFWAIDEKPTGSKDPFALRRAALGVIRLILENVFSVPLNQVMTKAIRPHIAQLQRSDRGWQLEQTDFRKALEAADYDKLKSAVENAAAEGEEVQGAWDRLEGAILWDAQVFLIDRLKSQLRQSEIRPDIIDACVPELNRTSGLPDGNDDLALLVKRATALQKFLDTDDGENLLQGFKRANNILTQAEDKDGVEYSFGADVKFAEEAEEKALFSALETAEPEIRAALERQDFEAAMSALAGLRGAVDGFFEAVQVNADNDLLRRNRLNLLSQIRTLCLSVADLRRVEG